MCLSKLENQDGRPGLWLAEIFLISSLKLLLNEFNETWQEARSQCPVPRLFSGRSENKDGHPGLWFAETFWTFSLQPLNRIQQKLTESKILLSSTKFVFFEPIGKSRWPPMANDLLMYLKFLLCNRLTELIEITVSSSCFQG